MTSSPRVEVVRVQVSDLERRLGIERTTLRRWIRAGKFPEPERFGQRRVWRLDVVERWEREHAQVGGAA
jgi:predicted DNA-binding transcriptional regulator AlpA